MKILACILVIGILVLAAGTNGFRVMTMGFDGDFTKNNHGESIVFKRTEEDVESLLSRMRVTVVYTQSVGGADVIYGYSNRLRGGVVIEGEKINVQFAMRGDTVTVGTPLIFGSF